MALTAYDKRKLVVMLGSETLGQGLATAIDADGEALTAGELRHLVVAVTSKITANDLNTNITAGNAGGASVTDLELLRLNAALGGLVGSNAKTEIEAA